MGRRVMKSADTVYNRPWNDATRETWERIYGRQKTDRGCMGVPAADSVTGAVNVAADVSADGGIRDMAAGPDVESRRVTTAIRVESGGFNPHATGTYDDATRTYACTGANESDGATGGSPDL